ncbi:MAG: S-layer homology domain-containing protein, partial [Clostridiales bacterium]|nr:S-layer homology domain-containing protein [Clostridiales bacterium]
EPDNTEYNVGDKLNITGLVVEATYSDESKNPVAYTTTPKADTVLGAVGIQTVTVSYTEKGVTKVTSFEITVSNPDATLNEIKVTPPSKTYYVGESLGPDDIVVIAFYDDGKEEGYPVVGYKITPLVLSTAGTQIIEVSYTEGGKTEKATFSVTVNNRPTGGGSTVSYIVTFNSNGGSAVTSKTVTENTKVAKPADPTKEDLFFAGWYTDAALTTAYNFDALVTKSFTLYAKWTDEEDDGEEEEEGNGFFTDVPESVWYYEDVKYVFEAGLMDGTGDNKFSPGISVTRAMLVTVLYRMEKSPEVDEPAGFSDVPAGTWYSNAVAWAEAEGIVEGYPDGTFKPNQNVSRQELATVLLRYAKFIGKDQISADPDDPVIEDDDDENADDETLDNLSGTEGFDDDLEFLDAARIGDWAKEGVAFCVKNGIIQGRPGNIFDPAASATRGELAAMLHRFLQNI